MNTSNQPVKKFEWNEDLAIEFALMLRNNKEQSHKEHKSWRDSLGEFKASKEVTDTPVQQERIKVTRMERMKQTNLGGNEPHLNIYFNQWSSLDKNDAIKQAIEAVLNDEVDNRLPLQMNKLVRDNEALKSLLEQMTNHAEHWKQLHINLYNDYADLVANSMDKKYTQSEVDTIRTNIWWAARVKNEGNYRFTFLEDYLKSLAEQKLKFGNNPKLGAAFYGEDGKLKEIVTATTPTSNADTKGQVLFITEDGVEMIGGAYVWLLSTNNWCKSETKVPENGNPFKGATGQEFKYFSTKEKAEQYILENSPKLSVNDVMGFFRKYFEIKNSMNPTHGEIRDAMIEVTQQKLNH